MPNPYQHLIGMKYENKSFYLKDGTTVFPAVCTVIRANAEKVWVRSTRLGVYSYPTAIAQAIYDDQRNQQAKPKGKPRGIHARTPRGEKEGERQ